MRGAEKNQPIRSSRNFFREPTGQADRHIRQLCRRVADIHQHDRKGDKKPTNPVIPKFFGNPQDRRTSIFASFAGGVLIYTSMTGRVIKSQPTPSSRNFFGNPQDRWTGIFDNFARELLIYISMTVKVTSQARHPEIFFGNPQDKRTGIFASFAGELLIYISMTGRVIKSQPTPSSRNFSGTHRTGGQAYSPALQEGC